MKINIIVLFSALALPFTCAATNKSAARLARIAGHMPRALQPATTPVSTVSATKSKELVADTAAIDNLLEELTADVHPLIKLYCAYKNKPCAQTLEAIKEYVATCKNIAREIRKTRDKVLGKTVYDLALQDNEMEVMKLLGGLSALSLKAAWDNNWALVVQCIKEGADINHVDNHHEYTVLMVAVIKGYLEVVKSLITSLPASMRAAAINHKNKHGQTALTIAINAGQSKIVAYLVLQEKEKLFSQFITSAL